jgi:hypothetical protein
MTPTKNWIEFVNATMAENRCTHAEAMRIAKHNRPDACTLMIASGASRRAVTFSNERASAPARKEALQKQTSFINEKMKLGHSYAAACKMLYSHPKLLPALPFVEIKLPKSSSKPAAPGRVQFSNVTDIGDIMPVGSPSHFALFRLPMTTTQEQWQAAFKANGSSMQSIHPAKVFSGLVELAQQNNSGLSYDDAIALCKSNFPDLWSQVELLAQKPD